MGNSDIRELSIIENPSYGDIRGEDVVVDASNWIYKYMTTTVEYTRTSKYTTEDNVEVPELLGCFRGIKKFKNYDINAIFVFDGISHDLKEGELKERKEKKLEAEEKAKNSTNEIERSKFDARTQHLTSGKVERIKKMVELCGFETIQAPGAAEAQAAMMSEQDMSMALSSDYDTVVFGAHEILRNFTSSNRDLELISFMDTLNEFDLSHDEFIWAVLLCGTDYNDGVHGVGPVTAVKKVKEYNSFEDLIETEEYEVENWQEILQIYQNPNVDISKEYSYASTTANVEALEEFILEEWEVAEDEVESTFEYLREHETDSTLMDF